MRVTVVSWSRFDDRRGHEGEDLVEEDRANERQACLVSSCLASSNYLAYRRCNRNEAFQTTTPR